MNTKQDSEIQEKDSFNIETLNITQKVIENSKLKEKSSNNDERMYMKVDLDNGFGVMDCLLPNSSTVEGSPVKKSTIFTNKSNIKIQFK